jgi:predicted nucleotide-binding protein
MHLDFLLVLDDEVRANNAGYVRDGSEIMRLARESGLADIQDSWSAARWIGELVTLGYVEHSPPGLGDRLPIPEGGYQDRDLYRFSDYRLTAAGYEAADRERRRRLEPVSGSGEAGLTLASVSDPQDKTPSIFIVHGRDTSWREQVARFLDRITDADTEVVILHEQPDQGRTVIEKFEDHAGASGYAVVIATGDDVGGLAAPDPNDLDLHKRARQNVVFELGFFFGSLGRARVAVLYEEGVERPTDVEGLVYIPLDHDWKIRLARELRAAGIHADLAKA